VVEQQLVRRLTSCAWAAARLGGVRNAHKALSLMCNVCRLLSFGQSAPQNHRNSVNASRVMAPFYGRPMMGPLLRPTFAFCSARIAGRKWPALATLQAPNQDKCAPGRSSSSPAALSSVFHCLPTGSGPEVSSWGPFGAFVGGLLVQSCVACEWAVSGELGRASHETLTVSQKRNCKWPLCSNGPALSSSLKSSRSPSGPEVEPSANFEPRPLAVGLRVALVWLLGGFWAAFGAQKAAQMILLWSAQMGASICLLVVSATRLEFARLHCPRDSLRAAW